MTSAPPEPAVPAASATAAVSPPPASVPAPPEALSAPHEQAVIDAFGGPPPAACAGARVDLAHLGECLCGLDFPAVPSPSGGVMRRAAASCGAPFYHRDLQFSLAGAIVPSKAQVQAGEAVTLDATLTNLTAARLPVVLKSEVMDLGEEGVRPFLVVRDATGKDVGQGGSCFTGRSAIFGDFLVILEPRGTAHYALAWKASTLVAKPAGTRCLFRTEPLAPGKYTIEWSLPIEPTQALMADTSTLRGAIEILP